MIAYKPTTKERIRAAVPAAAVHLLLAFALLRGLATTPGVDDVDALKVIDVPQLVPAPARQPQPSAGDSDSERRSDPREEGAASPPNLESRPTPVVAPPPPIPMRRPLPAAPTPGTGSDPSAGAAPIRGPGTGSGGIGDGTGSGDGGDGAGGGGGGGRGDGRRLTPPRLIRGSLSDSDYPRGLGEAGIGGTVSVRYTVETDGRVTGCTVTRSSGSDILDLTTCRLIERRFRFDPSRDRGRPIRSNIVENHEWVVEDLPEERSERRRRRRIF